MTRNFKIAMAVLAVVAIIEFSVLYAIRLGNL